MEAFIKKIDEVLSAACAEDRDTLMESEAYELLDAIFVARPESLFVPIADIDAGLLAPDLSTLKTGTVVAKVMSPDVLHKTDVGGLAFVANDADRLKAQAERIVQNVRRAAPSADIRGVMITELIDYPKELGHELIISFRQDDAFGPVVSFGLGGIDTENFAKWMQAGKSITSRAALFLDKDEIVRMVEGTVAGQKLLRPCRGETKSALSADVLVAAVESLSGLACEYSALSERREFTIEECELNPVVVTSDGRLVAVDALLRFSRRKTRRTQRPIHKIKRLLEPRSALVIGASASGMNVGRIILRNLIEGGGVNTDKIYVLHPRSSEIDGCRCFASVTDIPEQVDMAVVTIPAGDECVNLMIELIEREKTDSITLISSGFAETSQGKALEERLIDAIRKGHEQEDGGTIVNGGNCLGIVSLPGKYNTFFLPKYKLPFSPAGAQNTASISQSGAYLVTQASNLDGVINPRYSISFGNQIDLTAGDYLEYLMQDESISLFSVYLEGFKPLDGIGFFEACQSITKSGQDVLVYKAGRSAEGAMAAASHTAAMVGDYALNRDVLRQSGAIVVETLDEFFDYFKVFTLLADKNVSGLSVGIISNAGFEATAAADNLQDLSLANFEAGTMAKLRQLLPPGIVVAKNPIDATPIANSEEFELISRALLSDENVDCAVISIVCPTPFLENLERSEEHKEDISRQGSLPNRMISVFKNTKKPVVFAIDSGALYDPFVRMMETAGLPCFRRIDRAIRALSNFVSIKTRK
ncbi:MAG: acetate--CoA ligase family protein [Candidatus Coatesbacteria bacterium]|nr:acetate--CoA ligase family protein [Candidatus Coatesbacteria bacterium]